MSVLCITSWACPTVARLPSARRRCRVRCSTPARACGRRRRAAFDRRGEPVRRAGSTPEPAPGGCQQPTLVASRPRAPWDGRELTRGSDRRERRARIQRGAAGWRRCGLAAPPPHHRTSPPPHRTSPPPHRTSPPPHRCGRSCAGCKQGPSHGRAGAGPGASHARRAPPGPADRPQRAPMFHPVQERQVPARWRPRSCARRCRGGGAGRGGVAAGGAVPPAAASPPSPRDHPPGDRPAPWHNRRV
jgi:hypothetical protein